MAVTATKVELANGALSKIGAHAITSFVENTPEARLASSRYELCKRFVLGCIDWSFARTRLVLTTEATAPSFGYDYSAILPTDFLRIYRLADSDDVVVDDYTRESNKLLSNKSELRLIYIKDAQDADLNDPNFNEAMIYYLASDFLSNLGRSGDKHVAFYDQKFQKVMAKAAANDGRNSGRQYHTKQTMDTVNKGQSGGPFRTFNAGVIEAL